jgi:HEAT repeat protein
LAEIRSQTAIIGLIAHMDNDVSEHERAASAKALWHIGGERAIGALKHKRLLQAEWVAAWLVEKADQCWMRDWIGYSSFDNLTALRSFVAEQLGLAGLEQQVVEILIERMQRAGEELLDRYAHALAAIGDDLVASKLVDVLSGSSEDSLRIGAARALTMIARPIAVRRLAASLIEDNHQEVRFWAAKALTEIGSHAAMAALIKSLATEKETEVRSEAAWGLAAIGGEMATEYLLECARTDRVKSVRGEAKDALERITIATGRFIPIIAVENPPLNETRFGSTQ